jgi:hypothetical protein
VIFLILKHYLDAFLSGMPAEPYQKTEKDNQYRKTGNIEEFDKGFGSRSRVI